jgi:hypothetical protein
MARTQIQLPEELYERAKRFAARRGLSLAEITRLGLELFLDAYPDEEMALKDWALPKIMGFGTKVALEDLHDISGEEEGMRSVPQ